MKKLKYNFGAFCLAFAVGAVSWASEKQLLEKSNKLGALEVQQHVQHRMWEYAIANFIFTDVASKKEAAEIVSAEAYYKLAPAKRNALKSKNPKVKTLEKLVSQQEVQKVSSEISKLRKEVKALREKISNPDIIKEQVKKFNSSELQIEPTAMDHILGIEYEETEGSIQESSDQGPDLVIGHSKFYTQVDYAVLREIFKKIQITKNDVFYDLGSGYGRASFYGSVLYPEGVFKGVEYVKERVDETSKLAEKLKLENVKFYTSDVLKFDYSDGNIFFIFNPFPPLMPQVLAELHKISKKKKIKIIAISMTVIELNVVPWLKRIDTVPSRQSKTPVAIFESTN